MTRTADQILTEIRDLSDLLDRTPEGTADHARLTAQRDALRAEAVERSDAMRHPESVRTEIERIEARLAEFENRLIRAGYNEKQLGRTIQDPGAYRHTINRLLAEDSADEIVELRLRLHRLKAARGPDDRTDETDGAGADGAGAVPPSAIEGPRNEDVR